MNVKLKKTPISAKGCDEGKVISDRTQKKA